MSDIASEIVFTDPTSDSRQPFMRWQLAYVKTGRGLFCANVGLPVLEERDVKERLGAEAHAAWLAMKRAELVFRVLRNVATGEPVVSAAESVYLEP